MTWSAVELSERAARTPAESVSASLRALLRDRDAEVIVVEGYALVRTSGDISRLVLSRLVASLVPGTLTAAEVADLSLASLTRFPVGAEVRVTRGIYRHCKATITSAELGGYQVRVTGLRSLEPLVVLPAGSLELA